MDLATACHIIVGAGALALYWTALGVRKSRGLHARVGRLCLVLLVLVGVSVGPVLLARPGAFDPRVVVQMLYLTSCLTAVSWMAFAAVRHRRAPERFLGPLRRLGPALLALGAVVLLGGVADRDPVAVVLSWVGLVYGLASIAAVRSRRPLAPHWWLSWHLNAVCGLFNAVNGTVLYVVARELGLVSRGSPAQTGFQLATIAAALGLRLWFGRRLRAPLGIGRRAPGPSAPLAPIAPFGPGSGA